MSNEVFLGRACRAAVKHIKDAAGKAHWLLPLMECDGNDLVACSTLFVSTIFLLWLTASHVTSHILLTRGSEWRNMSGVLTEASHTHFLHPISPSVLGYVHAHTHTHVHMQTHFFMSPGQRHKKYWGLTGNPYS